jgi:hypothetical protein
MHKIALALIVFAVACSSNSNNAANNASSAASPSAQASSSGPQQYSLTQISWGASLPPGPELTALLADCEICHGREMWAQQRLSRGAWDAELTKMIKFGSPMPKSQQESVAIYLAKYLGPTVPRVGSQPTATAPPITYTAAPQ